MASVADVDIAITDSVDDKRRDADRREQCPSIGVQVHALQRLRGRRASAEPHAGRIPIPERLVAKHAGRVVGKQLVAVVGRPPAVTDLAQRRLGGLVSRGQPPGSHPVPGEIGPVHDQGGGSLGVGGGEHGGHGRALRVADDGGSLARLRVHDRTQVVHACLERRDARHAIRQSGPALVEDDEAAERHDRAIEVGQRGLFPAVLHVRYEAWGEDEVERPVPDDLVRDADLSAPRVARLWSVHADILPAVAVGPKRLDGGNGANLAEHGDLSS